MIHIHELFALIDIDVDKDKTLAEKIRNELKDKYKNFEYTDAKDTGFCLNYFTARKYFIGDAANNPFDLYILLKKNKDEVINKMKEFIECIVCDFCGEPQ